MVKKRLGDRLAGLYSDVMFECWIFDTFLEKILLIILIFLGVYGLLNLIMRFVL